VIDRAKIERITLSNDKIVLIVSSLNLRVAIVYIGYELLDLRINRQRSLSNIIKSNYSKDHTNNNFTYVINNNYMCYLQSAVWFMLRVWVIVCMLDFHHYMSYMTNLL